ncbi:MAG: pilus assembly protein PilY [Burkholderiales bacterium]|nr:pilus assembly protein PilY [Burkholderiales bacterium]
MNRNHNTRPLSQSGLTGPGVKYPLAALLSGLFGLTAPTATHADVTLISDQPLATTAAVHPKPNLLFILDDSGSMDSAFMPDDMNSTSKFGYWSPQCNGVAFDPTESYLPPVKADGSSYSNASYTAAWIDGYNTSKGTTNLAGSYYAAYSGSQPVMGWKYTFAGVDTTTPFYTECNTSISSGSTVFSLVYLDSASADMQQKYANWYAYYRKRYLLMRTAMGRALAKLDDSYRVGFSTISDKYAVDGTRYFRDTKDFDTTQKTRVYSSLYSAAPSSYTPLRGALSKAGRYFANKAASQTYDPMQYACQRNYALLSTDGYWNADIETTSYGPYVVNSNTLVGNQDGTESRPMLDSASTVTTRVTPYTATSYRDKTSNTQSKSIRFTRNMTVYTDVSSSVCSSKIQKSVSAQTATESKTQYFVTPQQATYSYSVTDTLINGLLSESKTSATTTSSWVAKTGTSTTTISTDSGVPTNANYVTTSTTSTCVSSKAATSYSTPTQTNPNWSPTTLTYTYSTEAMGAYTAGTPTSSSVTIGGVSNTLADVAEYYWNTDLRQTAFGNCSSTSSGTTRDVCNNSLTPLPTDANTFQHMNTYTIGLGTNGTLAYDANYLDPAKRTGDYAGLISGSKIWPEPGDGFGAPNIDDLWHAAVNGRGQYFSAMSVSDLTTAIKSVFENVKKEAGAAAAAATTTLELVAGDNNKLFSASYTTQEWTGDLQAFLLNGTTGVKSDTPLWSAQALLDAKTYSSRTIYFNSSSALTAFTYSNLTSSLKTKFNNLCTSSLLSQCSGLTGASLTAANNGDNVVNYIKGDRTNEIDGTLSLFRKRTHVLGDIINGAPVYVSKPTFNYSDAGYADFVTAQRSRKPVVYVAGNDGMLHAFSAADSDGGAELWAFVPTAVIPNLYKLADTNYASQHRYFVDGTPAIGDVKIGGNWKTILVGGLNKGGNSYYALDITDPNAPSLLWEFTDANMGYTFGNPIITKRQDGTWVVAVSSGLNNTSGDGKGHLYLINAATGAKLLDLATTAGSSSSPSGLGKINAWIEDATDNTSLRFYGGDMFGNLWRFDTDARYGSVASALNLAILQTSSSSQQPITTRPVTVDVSGKAVVIVGTGRYMGDTDITDTQTQSIYAIRDPLGTTGWGDVRADSTNFVQQTYTVSGTSAQISSNAVDWHKGGWWVDLPHTGERIFVNMALQLNALAIATAIPNGDACASGGSSWLYYLNAATGSRVVLTEATVGSQFSGSTLIVGTSYVKDSKGNLRLIVQDNKSKIETVQAKGTTTSSAGSAHRTSWRELTE